MNHPSLPTFHCCLTEPDGRRVGSIGFTARVVPRYLFIDEESGEYEIVAADDPEDRPMGYTRYDRIGSSVWMDRTGADRAVIFERAIA